MPRPKPGRKTIATGWTKARCLAALGPQLTRRGPYTVTVALKRPILLPATVEFAEQADSDHGNEPGHPEPASLEHGDAHATG